MDPWHKRPLRAASLGDHLLGEVFLALPEIHIQALDDYRRYKAHQAHGSARLGDSSVWCSDFAALQSYPGSLALLSRQPRGYSSSCSRWS
jgi:hypothetical protein